MHLWFLTRIYLFQSFCLFLLIVFKSTKSHSNPLLLCIINSIQPISEWTMKTKTKTSTKRTTPTSSYPSGPKKSSSTSSSWTPKSPKSPIKKPSSSLSSSLWFLLVLLPNYQGLSSYFYIEMSKVIEVETKYYEPSSPVCYNCIIQVKDTMKAPVYFMYKLNNFYQNQRRYIQSKSNYQLAGMLLVDTGNDIGF